MIPSGPVPSFSGGPSLTDQNALQKLALLIGGSQSGYVAKAGGTKAAATPITSCKARISTCATNADSVMLPAGYPGLEVDIYNAGAASLQVFGAGSDTINGIATGVGVAQATGVSAKYTCYDVVAGVGLWGRLLSA